MISSLLQFGSKFKIQFRASTELTKWVTRVLNLLDVYGGWKGKVFRPAAC